MQDLPEYLRRLQLKSGADEREIKRAYARELKLIDQENDPAGFQVLRQAYEEALAWSKSRAALGRTEEPRARADYKADFSLPRVAVQFAGLPRTSHTASEMKEWGGPIPVQLRQTPAAPCTEEWREGAAGVFADFSKNGDGFRVSGNAHSESAWRDELQRCLADPRLFHIAAREEFERAIATLLARGWKPGHEALLVAAGEIFDWKTDPRRLGSLGMPGALLNRAFDERLMFDLQEQFDKGKQRELIARLRSDTPPKQRELLRSIKSLERLAQRFPTWLPLITDTEKILHWGELFEQLPEKQRSRAFDLPEGPAPGGKVVRLSWRGILMVLFAVSTLGRLVAPEGGRQSTASSGLPASYSSQYAPPPVLPSQLNAMNIGARIKFNLHYRVPPDLEGNPATEYEVNLQPDGSILSLKKIKHSGLPGFDEAVALAIRESQPYPPGIPRSFVLSSRPKEL